MENLTTTDPIAALPSWGVELFVEQEPFWPLEIVRPMRLFKPYLGLEPGQRGMPRDDFLFRLITSSRSFNAYIRDELRQRSLYGESLYRDLENHKRGLHAMSRRVKRAIADLLDIEPSALDEPIVGRDGTPLIPSRLSTFNAFPESLFFRMFRGLTRRGMLFLPDDYRWDSGCEGWWKQAGIPLPPAESRFVDRLLSAAVFGCLVIDRWHRSDWSSRFRSLCDPKKHPFGNWLGFIKEHAEVRANTNNEMLGKLSSKRIKATEPLPDEARIKKWSCGSDMLDISAGANLTAGLSDAKALQRCLILARYIALIIDFVSAAALTPDQPKRADLQRVLLERVEYLKIVCDRAELAFRDCPGAYRDTLLELAFIGRTSRHD